MMMTCSSRVGTACGNVRRIHPPAHPHTRRLVLAHVHRLNSPLRLHTVMFVDPSRMSARVHARRRTAAGEGERRSRSGGTREEKHHDGPPWPQTRHVPRKQLLLGPDRAARAPCRCPWPLSPSPSPRPVAAPIPPSPFFPSPSVSPTDDPTQWSGGSGQARWHVPARRPGADAARPGLSRLGRGPESPPPPPPALPARRGRRRVDDGDGHVAPDGGQDVPPVPRHCRGPRGERDPGRGEQGARTSRAARGPTPMAGRQRASPSSGPRTPSRRPARQGSRRRSCLPPARRPHPVSRLVS